MAGGCLTRQSAAIVGVAAVVAELLVVCADSAMRTEGHHDERGVQVRHLE